jgi:hypothetical protein
LPHGPFFSAQDGRKNQPELYLEPSGFGKTNVHALKFFQELSKNISRSKNTGKFSKQNITLREVKFRAMAHS